jgi:nitrite reductase/ring-hydroxylating ferredoxin subunit
LLSLIVSQNQMIPLCNSKDLANSGHAVPFDVVYGGQTCSAFAVRFQGTAVAYLNRCAHVAMEMDYQPNRFFDTTGQWLMCATHGATYAPLTGVCQMGPCRGSLIKIDISESNGGVHWHTAYNLKPLEF